MNHVIIKRKALLPFPRSTKNRILFVLINLFLISGVVTLLVTIAFLTRHLHEADIVIKQCIPGFVTGIGFVIIYFAGFSSIGKTE